MERHRENLDFAAELRALRPAPRPAFTAELDARAEAGFPHRPQPGSSTFSRIAERIAAVPMRRLLAPAGASAVAAIVVATAIISLSESGPGSLWPRGAGAPDRTGGPAVTPSAGGDIGASQARVQAEAMPEATSAVGSSSTEHSDGSGLQLNSAPPDRLASGPYASQAGRRAIERSAQLTLATDPAEVREDAARVFEAVHSYDGIVLRSSIRAGKSGEAGATFDLLIPTAKFGDALAAFSQIAEVRSRHESTQDITAPTVGVGERLQDAQARVESLLSQLASADTEAERDAVEAELRRERFRVAALRSRLSGLERRANFSHVLLRIETGEEGAAERGEDGGSWGVDDAIGDAGHILAIAAGVTLIGLAILAPFAIIALLAWLGRTLWLRRSRERALGVHAD